MKIPYESGTARITSYFGEIRPQISYEPHKGIDLVGTNKNVVSVSDGVVVQSRRLDEYVQDSEGFWVKNENKTWEWGNYVSIQSLDGNVYYYCHLAERCVKQWETVKAGQIIGVEGSTGFSTGSHLHFEVRTVGKSINPCDILGCENANGVILSHNLKVNANEDKISAMIRNDNIPDWGKDAIRWMADRGYLKGDGNSFNLSDDLLRTLVIIYRMKMDENEDGK